MTDLASPSINDVDTDHHLDRTILPGNLPITGDAQTGIYVIRVPNVSPPIAAFGLQLTGDFYTDGISWVNESKFAKFITFHLQPGIELLYCDQLPYADVVGHHQQFAVLRTSPAEYNFMVKFTTGHLHDPKIVVTLPSKPQPG